MNDDVTTLSDLLTEYEGLGTLDKYLEARKINRQLAEDLRQEKEGLMDTIETYFKLLADNGDIGVAHREADKVLLEVLETAGYGRIVMAYKELQNQLDGFWYA